MKLEGNYSDSIVSNFCVHDIEFDHFLLGMSCQILGLEVKFILIKIRTDPKLVP
jgi:hypothetical protein